MANRTPSFLACPACRGALAEGDDSATCAGCGAVWPRNEHRYLRFDVRAGGAEETGQRLESYARHQEEAGERRARDFLIPWLEGAARVLDAGCGTGAVADALGETGIEAFGVDLPKATRFWAEAGRDPDRFFVADVTSLPFADAAFDAVLSMGVIEHVGTVTGHCTLAPDFRIQRARYAAELVRVTRPGGRILVTCPNKAFPVDLHHGPGDEAGRPGRTRAWTSRRLGLNVHRTWGTYHLLSFPEVSRLFLEAGARRVRPVDPRGYFAFEGVRSGPLSAVAGPARAWIEGLPARLRGTVLDPFVLAEAWV